MNEHEKIAAAYLPKRLADAVKTTSALWKKDVNEVRLRVGKPLSLNLRGDNVSCGVICKSEEVSETVTALCRHSLYSYAEEIKEGVITTDCGIRAGVCGRATVRGGRIEAVRDITSVNLRIPHRVPHAADELCALTLSCGSVIVYSPPGMGKTTVLRELIPLLSGKENSRRVAVIDTRYELSAMLDGCDNADVFLGYPRYDGIVAAVRTMSPEYVICDEVSSENDVQAVMYAKNAGVNAVCSCHAASKNDLYRNSSLARLIKNGSIGCLYGLRDGGAEVDILEYSVDG